MAWANYVLINIFCFAAHFTLLHATYFVEQMNREKRIKQMPTVYCAQRMHLKIDTIFLSRIMAY